MTLDIFPKARAPKAAPVVEPVVEAAPELPEPSTEAIEDAEKRRSRRGTRGGRAKKADGETTETTTETPAPAVTGTLEVLSADAAPAPPVRRPRRTKATIAAELAAAEAAAAEAAAEPVAVDQATAVEAAVEAADEAVADEAPVEAADAPAEDASDAVEEPVVAVDEESAALAAEADAEAVAHGEQEAFVIEGDEAEGGEIQREPRRRDRRGSRGGRGRGGDRGPRNEDGTPAEPAQGETEARQPDTRQPREPREPREPRPQGQPRAAGVGDGSLDSLARAIENQGRQLEQLVRNSQEDNNRRAGSPNGAPPPRVGIFVDTANIELAADRQRVRLDWSKILSLLTRERQLVRAIAYSPVHDDPSVSVETQRFVEPFLDRGFKIVTKPLKRFQDGSIKANVDIELALDVVTMCDRLDIVCLVSGDGDFEKLVELVQGKGIRVEVVSFGSSTAGNLKNAADAFIDFQSRLRDVRL